MLLRQLAVLALILGCTAESMQNNMGWFVTVQGLLRPETTAALYKFPEVLELEHGARITIIMLSAPSPSTVELLTWENYVFTAESNDPVELEMIASPPWNLQRLVQTAPTPLSGVYAPPAHGSGVSIYILDTGIYPDHREFGGRVRRVTDWKNEAPCFGETHGTWVASIAGGSTLGVAQNASLWDMKLPNGDNCAFYVCDAARALSWLLHHLPPAPFLVVMSWKTNGSPSLVQLCDLLHAQGAVLFAAAGNSGSVLEPCQMSPSNAGASTLSVGAVNDLDARASWSNYGPCVDIYAAGVSIIGAGTASTTALVVGDGTSAAAPGAAGVAAVLCELYKLTTPAAIEAALFEHSLQNVVTGTNVLPNFLVSLASPPPPPPSVSASIPPVVGHAHATRLVCACLALV